MQHFRACLTRLRVGLVCALFILAGASQLAAQPTAQPFSESIDVDIVNLDVVVTDKQGKPITGLTREDFTIFEDGEPMELTNFSAIERAAGEAEAGEDEAAIGDPAAADLPEQDRPFNLVIFVDNLNMRPENRKALFENLRKTL
ncbi:MAG: hypothetical protein AAF560_31750, partial [Acidobacteriota bacterium]